MVKKLVLIALLTGFVYTAWMVFWLYQDFRTINQEAGANPSGEVRILLERDYLRGSLQELRKTLPTDEIRKATNAVRGNLQLPKGKGVQKKTSPTTIAVPPPAPPPIIRVQIPPQKSPTPPPTPEPSSVQTYRVRPGDTLGKIAQTVYGDKKLWGDIWEANRSTLPDPDRLRVGQALVLPPIHVMAKR